MGLAPAVGPLGQLQNYLKGQNTYPNDQCTWQVKNDAPWIPNYLGDASGWFARLKGQGYPVSQVPVPGSVMIYKPGAGGSFLDGHVSYVTKVNRDWTVDVDERNWSKAGEQGQRYSVDWRNVVQGFALDKGEGAFAAQYATAYAQQQAPPNGPSYSATQAGDAIGGWASGLVSKPFLGVLQIGIGALLLLAGVAIFALLAFRGAQAAGSSVAGTVGRARALGGGRRPVAPQPRPVREIDVRTPAGKAEARRAIGPEGR